MKRFRYMLLAAALIVFAAACGKPGPEPAPEKDPVFPAVVDRNLNAGESVTFTFTAETDWEISIPTTDLTWFYIDDNGMKEFRVRGQKGQASVTLCTENLEDNYDIHVCHVSMKMNGKTAEIGRITLIPIQRMVSVFSARRDEKGNFMIVGSGEFVYHEELAGSLRLVWPEGLSTYTLPVKVVSNFDWAITADYPEWLEVSKTTSEGTETTLVLRADLSKCPLDDQGGKINFMDMKKQDIVFSAVVTIPGCKDIVFSGLNGGAIEMNILGECSQNGSWMPSYSFNLTSTRDARVIAVEKNDGKLSYSEDSWLKVAVSYPGGIAGENVVQDRVVTVSSDRNPGADREAVLLAIPAYRADGTDLSKVLFNASATAIAPEYEKFVLGEVKQAGLDPSAGWGVIVPVNSEFMMAVKGAGIHRTAASEPYYESLSSTFGTSEIYTLEYNNWFSYEAAELAVRESVSEVKYYLPDGSSEDYSYNLSVVNPNPERSDVFSVVVEYFEEGFESAVALYDDKGAVVAVIICRLTETFWPDVRFDGIGFVAYDLVGEDGDPEGNILPQNVLLEELKSGEVYDQYKAYDVPVWRLVYYARNSERNAMIYVPPFPMGSEDAIGRHPDPSWMSVEGALSEKGLPYIHVTMNDKLPETGNVGHVVLRGGGRPLFVLVCEREFMNQN